MNSGKQKRILGIFPNLYDAEFALNELRDAGFSMEKVSVVMRDGSGIEENAIATISNSLNTNSLVSNDNNGKEAVTRGAIAGSAWGGVTGLLVGFSVLLMPGIGSVTVAGSGLATAFSGSAIGAVTGGFLGTLMSLDISEEVAKIYNQEVSQDEYLILIEGFDRDLHQAASILLELGIQEWKIYNAPNLSRM
ncbi:hypothetical protein NUACC21_39660 [Scytonema sp. NUACC21]